MITSFPPAGLIRESKTIFRANRTDSLSLQLSQQPTQGVGNLQQFWLFYEMLHCLICLKNLLGLQICHCGALKDQVHCDAKQCHRADTSPDVQARLLAASICWQPYSGSSADADGHRLGLTLTVRSSPGFASGLRPAGLLGL